MIPALLSFAMVLPAQVLCLLPVWHQLKPGRHKTVILLAVLDAVLLPAGAWITFRYGLDINYILLPLLLLFLQIYKIYFTKSQKSLFFFRGISALPEMPGLQIPVCFYVRLRPHGHSVQSGLCH